MFLIKLNYYHLGRRAMDIRKRKVSTGSSETSSEPPSPNIKKQNQMSTHQTATIVNNVTGITTNVLPRGTLVTLTGTTATQTPKRKYRGQNFSDQLVTSRLTTQVYLRLIYKNKILY